MEGPSGDSESEQGAGFRPGFKPGFKPGSSTSCSNPDGIGKDGNLDGLCKTSHRAWKINALAQEMISLRPKGKLTIMERFGIVESWKEPQRSFRPNPCQG
ncbi:hypothetical protein TURU_001106 [Turdus rufiventris]|nr:hypothetical protein TURU_001106 [Turdus rufiventris]